MTISSNMHKYLDPMEICGEIYYSVKKENTNLNDSEKKELNQLFLDIAQQMQKENHFDSAKWWIKFSELPNPEQVERIKEIDILAQHHRKGWSIIQYTNAAEPNEKERIQKIGSSLFRCHDQLLQVRCNTQANLVL